MLKKYFIILSIFLLQTNAEPKIEQSKKYNQKYITNYFSALLSYSNDNTEQTIRYLNGSKELIHTNKNFLKFYIFSLIEENQMSKAIKELKKKNESNVSNFFEAKLIVIVNDIFNKNYYEAKKNLNYLRKLEERSTFELIISDTLESYVNLFNDNKFYETENNYGQLSLINKAFQNCYLNNRDSSSQFISLINSEENDYSRYLFFYLIQLIKEKKFENLKNISSTIDPLNSNLLIMQSKQWIEYNELSKFNNFFSCENPNDILAEFFFVISNLYSTQKEFKKSNFYLKISKYLNEKFYFNSSLLAENYFLTGNYSKSLDALKDLDRDEEVYKWYKIKKTAQIISLEKSGEDSIKYIEKNLKKFSNPSSKIAFDTANIYKNFGYYEKSIAYFDICLGKVKLNSDSYAKTLYRRGGSYERMGNYKKSDKDFLESLKISPDDPYVLNYLAYNWLEREYKIGNAIKMLLSAYKQKSDDPYISDSLGWAFFLQNDLINSEKYLNKAIQIRPNDPVIMDHYGDVLWKLGRKLEARYFWLNTMQLKDYEDVKPEELKTKLLKGL